MNSIFLKFIFFINFTILGTAFAVPKIAKTPFWSISYEDSLFFDAHFQKTQSFSLSEACGIYQNIIELGSLENINYERTSSNVAFGGPFSAVFRLNKDELLKSMTALFQAPSTTGQENSLYLVNTNSRATLSAPILSPGSLTAISTKLNLEPSKSEIDESKDFDLILKGKDLACDFANNTLQYYVYRRVQVYPGNLEYLESFYEKVNTAVHESFRKSSSKIAKAAMLGFEIGKLVKEENAQSSNSNTTKKILETFGALFNSETFALNEAAWSGAENSSQELMQETRIVVPKFALADIVIRLKGKE